MVNNWKGLYRLLDQYQKGTINPIKRQVMDFWYDSLGSEQRTEHSEGPTEQELRLKDEMWVSIRQGADERPVAEVPVAGRRWWQTVYVKLAAACLVLMVAFFTYKRFSGTASIIAQVPDSAMDGMLQSINSDDKNKVVRLSDGSTVSLHPGAVLYYPQTFAGAQRKVYLKGDGLFEVTPDKSHPFLVYSNHIITRVVGTSFVIRQDQKGSVEVAVLTGIVKVQKNVEDSERTGRAEEVTLTPNKKVTFFPQTQRLITGLVEHPVVIEDVIKAIDETKFNFRDVALSDIVLVLKKAYGVDIELSDAKLKNCSITADVSQPGSLFEKLDILTGAIGAQYEVTGEKIVIAGDGCPTE